jgi:DNA repair exonuclease SbcCD ATPase subunit
VILKGITLERFGQLDRQEFTFSPGLNLIKGPNEAGKSMLQKALLFALMGNPRHSTLERSVRVADHISWGENIPFNITVEFDDTDGVPYRLSKDWASQSVCLTDLQTGSRIEDLDGVQRALAEMLGCDSLKLLQSTVCVEQDAIDDISAGRREISDQLQSIVTSGGLDEVTVSAVLEKLKIHIDGMKKGLERLAKTPGPIKVKQDEIVDLESKLVQISPRVERLEKGREQLIALNDRIKEIETELTPAQSLLELCEKRFDWEKQSDTRKTREEELRTRIEQIVQAAEQIETAEEELVALKGFGTVAGQTEQEVSKLGQRAHVLQEQIEQQSGELEHLREKHGQAQRTPVRPAFPVLPLAGAGIGGVLLIVGLLLGLSRSSGLGIALGLLGLGLGIGCLVWFAVLVGRDRQPPDMAGQIADRQGILDESQQQYHAVQSQLAQQLAAYGCNTVDEFLDNLEKHRELVAEKRESGIRRDTLLGDQTLPELIGARKVASRHRMDAEEALETPGMQMARELTALQYASLQQRVESLKKELADKEREHLQHQTIIENATYSNEDVRYLEERKASAEETLARLMERLEVYHLARSAIQLAKEQTMRSARDELEPKISSYLSQITGERYREVQADDDLNLKVFSKDKGDWVLANSDELSRGTLDQLYLAARLALMDLLYHRAGPPLLLDDPFVKFDPQRRAQAVGLCKQIAEGRQVLLFTCHDDYDAAVDWIVELPGLATR